MRVALNEAATSLAISRSILEGPTTCENIRQQKEQTWLVRETPEKRAIAEIWLKRIETRDQVDPLDIPEADHYRADWNDHRDRRRATDLDDVQITPEERAVKGAKWPGQLEIEDALQAGCRQLQHYRNRRQRSELMTGRTLRRKKSMQLEKTKRYRELYTESLGYHLVRLYQGRRRIEQSDSPGDQFRRAGDDYGYLPDILGRVGGVLKQ
ncbi:MAG: hypothetical protein M1835_003621 [Candelina submexicana]|nr:MAG: hypothetical protein M1835_003621 [Candelina submexicana]